jgi:hypothetical protein
MLTLFTRLILACPCMLLESGLGSKPHVARLTLVLLMTLKSAIGSTAADIHKKTNKQKLGIYMLLDDGHVAV